MQARARGVSSELATVKSKLHALALELAREAQAEDDAGRIITRGSRCVAGQESQEELTRYFPLPVLCCRLRVCKSCPERVAKAVARFPLLRAGCACYWISAQPFTTKSSRLLRR